MKVFIWDVVENLIVFIIAFALYFIKLLKRETLIEKCDGVADVVLKLLVGGMLMYFTFFSVIPSIQDIPNIIHKNIYTIEGISHSYCTPSKLYNMSAYIFDEETQDEIYIDFKYKGTIEIGDKLIIQYLPNSKYGVLIEKNGEIIRKRIE